MSQVERLFMRWSCSNLLLGGVAQRSFHFDIHQMEVFPLLITSFLLAHILWLVQLVKLYTFGALHLFQRRQAHQISRIKQRQVLRCRCLWRLQRPWVSGIRIIICWCWLVHRHELSTRRIPQIIPLSSPLPMFETNLLIQVPQRRLLAAIIAVIKSTLLMLF